MLDAAAHKRLHTVLRTLCLLVCAGLFYAWISHRFGVGIPCIFFRLTGFKCPGCGVTRMCTALLHGQIAEAFRQNRAVLLLLPAGCILTAVWCARFIRTGERILRGWPKAAAVCILCVLLLFGAVRNVFGW